MTWLPATAVALLSWVLAAAPAPANAGQDIEARSADGVWILRADNDRRELVVQRAADGDVVRRIPVADRRGASSRVARVLDAPPRRSFVALLADLPEAWELSYDPQAAPVFDGLVHDYRMGEGLASTGPFPVRRIVLEHPLSEAVFSDDFAHFVARAGPRSLHVVNLHVRRRIETVAADGDVVVGDAVHWRHGADDAIVLRDRRRPLLHRLAVGSWRWLAPIDLPQPAAALALDAARRLVVTLGDGTTLRIDPR